MNVNAREQPLLAREPSVGREGQTNSEGMKVVKLLDQASEDGPRDSLREQVGDHRDAGEVFDGDDTTADEIAKELGGTQGVLGLLEGDGVEGHADGGLGVALDDAGGVDDETEIDKQLADEDNFLVASMVPKNSASALESVTERCIFENQ